MKNLGVGFLTRCEQESQNQTSISVIEEHNKTNVKTVRCQRQSQIKDGCKKPEVEMKQRNISASIQYINEIPMATFTFMGSSNTIRHRVSDKSKVAALTGNTSKTTH